MFRGPVEQQKLQAWVLEHDPRLQLKSFNRRIEAFPRFIGAAVNRIQPFEPAGVGASPAPAQPEGITPELLEMAMKLKTAGLG